MKTLFEDAREKVQEGMTTIEEVMAKIPQQFIEKMERSRISQENGKEILPPPGQGTLQLALNRLRSSEYGLRKEKSIKIFRMHFRALSFFNPQSAFRIPYFDRPPDPGNGSRLMARGTFSLTRPSFRFMFFPPREGILNRENPWVDISR